MNSWLDLTQTIASDTSDSIQKFSDLHSSFFTELTSVQTELNNSLVSENTRKYQQFSECKSLTELGQLHNQVFAAKINAGVKAFSQFLAISGNYRNTIHDMAEDSLLSLGDNSRG